MGCGQSKILIYHRKSKAEKNSKNNWVGDDSDPSDSHPDDTSASVPEGGDEGIGPSESDRQEESDGDSLPHLLQQSDISTSQIDFFKMLDEKIENGPDYEEDEVEREAERQRLQRLLHEWMPMRRVTDTQRFPTAYQPCPPSRPPPRICPRPPLYPTARAYIFNRAASVEAPDSHYYETYNPIYAGMDPRLRTDQPYPLTADPYGSMLPMEQTQSYSRMVATPAPYVTSLESQDFYNRRVMLAKAGSRAMSFDANPYSRALEMHDQYSVEPSGSSEYTQRARDQHHNPYGSYMAAPESAVHYNPGHDQVQYMARPPPREIPPLQGAPGPPHGSPRPLTVRLPTSAMWRRPRGPVTELA